MNRPTRADTAARMVQHFKPQDCDAQMNQPVKRGNPVGWVLAFFAVVAVLATVLALMT